MILVPYYKSSFWKKIEWHKNTHTHMNKKQSGVPFYLYPKTRVWWAEDWRTLGNGSLWGWNSINTQPEAVEQHHSGAKYRGMPNQQCDTG